MSKFKKNWKFAKMLRLVKKKTPLSKVFFSLDVGDMRCVCFFGVFSSSPVCTICLQSDLSLE